MARRATKKKDRRKEVREKFKQQELHILHQSLKGTPIGNTTIALTGRLVSPSTEDVAKLFEGGENNAFV